MSEGAAIFAWQSKPRSSWTLALCIFLMLFLHSAAFFIFQAALPERSTVPRTAPPVQILTPFALDGSRSPENEALLRWIESEDPAIVSKVPVVEPPDLLAVPYRPSFLIVRTAPLAAPAEPATIQFPPARDPMSVILGSARGSIATGEVVIEPVPTRLEFSGEIQRRAPQNTKVVPPKIVTKPVNATRFLVGVDPVGDVRFYFLQKPSGEPRLDAAAGEILSDLKFAPSTGVQTEWGAATFRWGDDATAEPE